MTTLGCGGVDIAGCTKCKAAKEGEETPKKCETCTTGYGLNNKKENGGTKCEKCELENCENCDQEEEGVKCNKCKEGFAYDNGNKKCSESVSRKDLFRIGLMLLILVKLLN